jgi:hypothetical protein
MRSDVTTIPARRPTTLKTPNQTTGSSPQSSGSPTSRMRCASQSRSRPSEAAPAKNVIPDDQQQDMVAPNQPGAHDRVPFQFPRRRQPLRGRSAAEAVLGHHEDADGAGQDRDSPSEDQRTAEILGGYRNTENGLGDGTRIGELRSPEEDPCDPSTPCSSVIHASYAPL